MDVIYLDFRKAFDTVPSDELSFIQVMDDWVTGPLWLWFKNYLSNHIHYVELDGACTNHLRVLSGVPQGSILAPLLILIHINDLLNSIINSFTSLFADNTNYTIYLQVLSITLTNRHKCYSLVVPTLHGN